MIYFRLAKPFLFFYFPPTEVATCSPRLPIFAYFFHSITVRPRVLVASTLALQIYIYNYCMRDFFSRGSLVKEVLSKTAAQVALGHIHIYLSLLVI